MSDIPNPKWRDHLTVAAQVAAVIACCATLTVAIITVLSHWH